MFCVMTAMMMMTVMMMMVTLPVLVSQSEASPLQPRPLALSVIKHGDQISLNLDPEAEVNAVLLILEESSVQKQKDDLRLLKKVNSTCPNLDLQVFKVTQRPRKVMSGAEETGFGIIAAEDIGSGEIPAWDIDSVEIPAEDTRTWEIPSEDIGSGEIPSEDTGTREIPSEDTGSGEIPSEDTGSGEIPSEDIDSGEIITSWKIEEEIPPANTNAERAAHMRVFGALEVSSDVTLPEDLTKDLVNNNVRRRFRNCLEVQEAGYTQSGVYTVYPSHSLGFTVYCDMDNDGGGWTVIQRRDHKFCQEENFYRLWDDYVKGFGNLSQEFWLGLENIHDLTSQTPTELRVDLENFKNKTGWVKYGVFKVKNKDTDYRLWVKDYSGVAGDGLAYHNGARFTTMDKDHDTWGQNCAISFKGGWWYRNCHYTNLNGLRAGRYGEQSGQYIVWSMWEGITPIRSTEMKVRPIRRTK
ncbi:angiopoietin-related protein 1-like [Homarus americanus]|uniref:angiopoietin-related protein 1-like n=1 Tax=Homarus americanus TaxID=6706 RepID=UPI001C46D17A|nr:angiopoietin-related protein 1-like [Homarus americanus]